QNPEQLFVAQELINKVKSKCCGIKVLLEHKGYFIESDRLKEEIWPDGSVSKDALTATAKRLKEDLSPIPGLVIESARGKGYSLKIVSGE
ncbi:winged helix-turn-helix domain-containing protein, partial [Parabacteroides distasonis]|uniref:winged helix-turn-helix domain-containing protein n=1 Tax=Parabacteroides distasonis TaxID=823 RepID=UPI0039B3CDC9